MSSNRINNYGASGAGNNQERQVAFDVRLPDRTPSRAEIARAVYAHFGFTEADDSFLRARYGLDPVQYFANTLRFNPRSVTTDSQGRTNIRISLSESDYQNLAALAASRRPTTTTDDIVTTNAQPFETLAARTLYDRTPATRDALLNQTAPAQTTSTTTNATTSTNTATTNAPSEEGVGSFFEGAILGDFSDNDSWSRTGGQVVVGVIPIVGQIADARDTVAAIGGIIRGEEGAWTNLGAAAIGWIPLVGDGAKGLIRVGRKVAAEGTEEIVEQGTRQLVNNGARELTQTTVNEVTRTTVNTVADQTDEATRYGVSFFNDRVVPYIDRPDATLGRSGQAHFFMPLEDASGIRNASDAARASGNAPSVLDAYLNGTPVYGLSFPMTGLDVRVPTALDAGGYPHFLEGGRTAVRTADPNSGFLLNPTREFVVPGGNSIPRGSVLFELNADGSWKPLRRF